MNSFICLVVYNSSSFGKSKNANTIVQDKDTRISVFTAVRFLEQGKRPEEYCDFLEAAITGIRLTANRSDKLVYPESVTYVKEENGYWYYETIFVCPNVNMQENNL